MISLVIPTLWKSEYLKEMLDIYVENPFIGDIVLIDNSKGFDEHYGKKHHKINLIVPDENLYVNPSWNLGVKNAKCSIVGILNDDIKFNPELFNFVFLNRKNMGIMGMSNTNYRANKYEPTIEKMTSRQFGWGCMFFFMKNDWVDIPEDLRVWYGDDYIFKYNPTECKKVSGVPVKTLMSTTSHRSDFNPIKAIDKKNWHGKYNTNVMNRGYKP